MGESKNAVLYDRIVGQPLGRVSFAGEFSASFWWPRGRSLASRPVPLSEPLRLVR